MVMFTLLSFWDKVIKYYHYHKYFVYCNKCRLFFYHKSLRIDGRNTSKTSLKKLMLICQSGCVFLLPSAVQFNLNKFTLLILHNYILSTNVF